LFLPFTIGRKRIKKIGLRAVRWDQSIRWQEGLYQSALQLLFEVADQPEDVIREIRYPDVERVLMQFIDLMPNEIRESVVQGLAPKQQFLTNEQMADLLANNMPPVESNTETEQPAVESESVPIPEEPVELAPEQYDDTVKSALEKGEKPWPGYPWAPGAPSGPELKPKQKIEKKEEKQAEETGVGFDLS
jgi:hypothetical protein